MVWANNAWSTLRTWDQAGRATADKAMAKPGSADFIAEDPTGGVVVWHMEAPETGSHVLESYDEHLNLRWRVLTPGSGDPGALAVDRAGRTLVLYGADFRTAPKAVDGIWVDRDGTATTFRALGPQKDWTHLMGFALTQRVGSGLFLQSGDDWVGQLDSLSTSVAAPPDWLSPAQHEAAHGPWRNGIRGAVAVHVKGLRPDHRGRLALRNELRGDDVRRQLRFLLRHESDRRLRRDRHPRVRRARRPVPSWRRLHVHLAMVARLLPLRSLATLRP